MWNNSFDAYYQWAVANGYQIGRRIVRFDKSKPRSPDNCYVCTIGVDSRSAMIVKASIDAFDQTVAQFVERLDRAAPEAIAKTVRLIQSGRLWHGYRNNYSSAKNRD